MRIKKGCFKMTENMTDVVAYASNDYDDVERQLSLLSRDSKIISTVIGDDFETREQIANAVLSSISLQDEMLETPFDLVGWIAQIVKVTPESSNDADGRVVDENGRVSAIRVILLDANGNAYSATSEGVVSSLGTLQSVMGHPSTWKRPVRVVAKRVKTRNANRYIITLRIVPANNSTKK